MFLAAELEDANRLAPQLNQCTATHRQRIVGCIVGVNANMRTKYFRGECIFAPSLSLRRSPIFPILVFPIHTIENNPKNAAE